MVFIIIFLFDRNRGYYNMNKKIIDKNYFIILVMFSEYWNRIKNIDYNIRIFHICS